MRLLVLALAVGVAFGVTVRLLGLPLPAPNTFAGVLAVAGVYLGALIIGALK